MRRSSVALLLVGFVLALTTACGSVTGISNGGELGALVTALEVRLEWLAPAPEEQQAPEALGERPAPLGRAATREGPLVTMAAVVVEEPPEQEDPRAVTLAAAEDTLVSQDAAVVETPEPEKAGALLVMLVAGKVGSALEARAAALVVPELLEAAAPVQTPRTPAQAAASAVPAAPCASVQPGAAPAGREDTWGSITPSATRRPGLIGCKVARRALVVASLLADRPAAPVKCEKDKVPWKGGCFDRNQWERDDPSCPDGIIVIPEGKEVPSCVPCETYLDGMQQPMNC